jgi:hypothetical protein
MLFFSFAEIALKDFNYFFVPHFFVGLLVKLVSQLYDFSILGG